MICGGVVFTLGFTTVAYQGLPHLGLCYVRISLVKLFENIPAYCKATQERIQEDVMMQGHIRPNMTRISIYF